MVHLLALWAFHNDSSTSLPAYTHLAARSTQQHTVLNITSTRTERHAMLTAPPTFFQTSTDDAQQDGSN
eukprot:11610845-Karenia_brevis.AAC.1